MRIIFITIEMDLILITRNPFNTAGWTTVEVTGQIIEKIGPILATKYSEVN